MKDNEILPHHIEGHRGGTWILQDYGDVVVHLFSEEAREFYDLDRLWQDAKVVDLSEILAPGEQGRKNSQTICREGEPLPGGTKIGKCDQSEIRI